MHLTDQAQAVPAVRSLRRIDPATIEDLIPPGDPLLELPRPSLAVLVSTLGVTEANLLLQVPDARILSELKSREQCGDRLLTDVSSWLTKQREARNEGQWAPARSKAFADQVISQMREDLALAIRETVRRERIQPEDLAKRCGTSREAVASLLAGSAPSSLELSLRMAGAIGIGVELRARTPHASLAVNAMAERTCGSQASNTQD